MTTISLTGVVAPFAVAGGTFIVLAVVVAILLAVVLGFYTYKGSAIDAHPSDGLDGAPGSAEPSQASGKGRTIESHEDEPGGGGFSTHGTR